MFAGVRGQVLVVGVEAKATVKAFCESRFILVPLWSFAEHYPLPAHNGSSQESSFHGSYTLFPISLFPRNSP